MLHDNALVADTQHMQQRDFHCNSTATAHTHKLPQSMDTENQHIKKTRNSKYWNK